jgi:hypothetical protein
MVRRAIRFAAATALVTMPALVQAQATCQAQLTCNVGATASMTIPALVRLNIPSTTITLDASGLTDLSAATSITAAFSGVNVRANAGWTLTLGSADANWTYVGTESGVRTAGTLGFSSDAGANYTAVSGGATVSTGARTNGATIDLIFRASFPAGYDDAANRPGAYTLPLTFTLSAP